MIFKKGSFNTLFLMSFFTLYTIANPVSVIAQSCPEGTKLDTSSGLCLPELKTGGIAGSQNFGQLATSILELLFVVVGILAVMFIIIGGYQYITSHGNEEQAEKGKRTLINSIIGLVVVILAYTIVTVIANTLTSETVI